MSEEATKGRSEGGREIMREGKRGSEGGREGVRKQGRV